MKYAFIAQHKKTWPVDLMCRVLGVTRNGYYSYCKRGSTTQPDPEHQEMLDAVREISEASGETYGSRRMRHALNALGYPVGRWKARRLMREAGVFARYRKKYKVTTNSNHKQPVFENVLDRQFSVSGPDQAYVSDITYVWTQEGWLYLAVVIDLFSRRVVGWSMSRKGDCWDNSVAESFFASLKKERVHWCNYQTRIEAQQDVMDYITMFYNSRRLHSYLGYVSPSKYESTMAEMRKAA